jgi:Ca2+-binding RTX toxin-like protein
MPVISGSNVSDAIFGTGSDDTIFGLAGNDFLSGVGGNDKLIGGVDNDKLNGGAGSDTLDGGSGTDTADYANSPVAVDVRLTSNLATDGFGGFDQLISIENIDGSAFDDALVGNDLANLLRGNAGRDAEFGGSGNDLLSGGSGNDVLNGELGQDRLTGGSGFDVFRYADLSHSGVGSANHDFITDFEHGSDDIDLASIDAKAGAVGNQVFTFIGSAAFTDEGQVRAVTVGASTIVQLNTSGASGAEAEIELFGNVTLSASDFFL